MTTPLLVNLSSLLDDAKCFALIRQHRWPEGVRCRHCNDAAVARDGHADTQRHCQRYRCTACGSRFDDLSGTVLAGHHQSLRVWGLCLYFMGLTLSNRQIAQDLDLAETDPLRSGITAKLPPGTLDGVVAADEVDVVAGHKGTAAAVAKKSGPDGGIGSRAHPAAARWRKRSRRSSA